MTVTRLLRPLLLSVLIVVLLGVLGTLQVDAADPILIEVTSTADQGGLCPSATQCTLRKAIELANAGDPESTTTITFAEAVFPADDPAIILIGSAPLPPITASSVTIDGTGRGVRVQGQTDSLTPSLQGLVIAGNGGVLKGLTIANFLGACVQVSADGATIGGDPANGAGNAFESCGTAIHIGGSGARAIGNDITGLRSEAGGSPSIGIRVTGSNALVGTSGGVGFANRIGPADVAILVEAGSGSQVSGNRLGLSAGDLPAQLGTGIEAGTNVSGLDVRANTIANAATGVSVAGSTAGPSASAVSIRSNVFTAIAGLAIDLNGDGLRNLNDSGDTDTGANGLLNAPHLSRAVQARVSGSTCAGCEVQLYVASHKPGGADDYGSTPLPGGTTTADASGAFVFEGPPVAPGDWITALATDAAGNTSEFAASTRVGAGSVQCGNPSLLPGWNLVGYFGAEPIQLGSAFPAGGTSAGAVTAIFHLAAGTAAEAWFANTTAGRTLTALEPGEAYWMFASAPVALAGGFSVSVPVPSALEAGWNTFTYIGATAPVPDALSSIQGKYETLYSWDATNQRWAHYGDPTVPAWAQDFTQLQACAAYAILMTSPGTLTPLQP